MKQAALLTVAVLFACASWATCDKIDGVPARPGRAGVQAVPPVQRLQRLINQAKDGATRNQTADMVKAAKEMVKGVVKRAERSLPGPAVASNMVDALQRAAAAAAVLPVHRGQLLTERSKLLNALGRVEVAREEAEAAALVFRAELAVWAAHPEAGAPHTEGVSEARQQAAAALGSLLDVAALWRQLGREGEANGVLSEALRAAPLVPSTPNFLRALAQLSEFDDEQLEVVEACMAFLEQEAGFLAPAEAAQPPPHLPPHANASDCAWLRLRRPQAKDSQPVEPVPDMHRLYYAAHRGLHARGRYAESWRALSRAKALHYHKHEYKLRDFERMVEDTRALFPSSRKFEEAVAEEEGQGAAGAAQQPPSAPADGQPAPAQAGSNKPAAPAGSKARLQRAAKGAAQRGQQPGDAPAAEPASGEGEAAEMIPIFVMGLPRSGSTLTEQILSSHPEVYGAGEHTALRTVTGKLQDMIKGNGTATRSQLAGLRRRYLQAMRARIPPERRGARWLVDKALSNAWLVGHIALMMPRACLVHAVRHPADAALSSYQQSFFPDKVPWSFNLTNVAAHVKAHHRLMAHWDAVLPGRVLHLHYSHMVLDQEGTTRRLVEHCGLPWDPAFLRFYENERAVQTASQLQVKKPIYSSSLSKWPKYREGLAPLLVELHDTILRYEHAAGLPSSKQALDEVRARWLEAQAQGQTLDTPAPSEVQLEGPQDLLAEAEAASTTGAASAGDGLHPGRDETGQVRSAAADLLQQPSDHIEL